MSPAAPAAALPLVVVVESAERSGPAPELIRQAISSELGTPVVAPTRVANGEATDLLVVAVDRSTVSMSLRAGTKPFVSRTIATSFDRASRLQEIAWLAGNLTREQVGMLLATPPPPVKAATPEALPAEGLTKDALPLQPPPLTQEHAEPATRAQQPREAPSADVVSPAMDHQASPAFPVWTMTGAAGPTYMPTSTFYDGTYQLEVQRQAEEGSSALGVAIEVGPGTVALGAHVMGAAAFVARTWRWGPWLAETTAGAGLEALRSVSYSFDGQGQPTFRSSLDPALYLRATGAAGWALTSSVDLIARVTGHVGSSGWRNGFVGATAGLRVRLP